MLLKGIIGLREVGEDLHNFGLASDKAFSLSDFLFN